MSNYRNAYGAGGAPHSRPFLGQDLYFEANARHHDRFLREDDDDDLAADLLDRNSNIEYAPPSPAPAAHAWHNEHGAVDASGSDGDREDNESGDEDNYHEPIWASDSEEEEEGNELQQYGENLLAPVYDANNDHADNSDGNGDAHIRQDSEDAASIDDDQDEDRSGHSRIVSDSEDNDNPTPSPSPSLLLAPLHSDSEPHARSGSDLGTIADSEAETDYFIDLASPSAPGGGRSRAVAPAVAAAPSSSQGSRSEPRDPHSRAPVRRRRSLSDQSDIDIEDYDYYNNDRPSPRRPSLTPVYHPNRRLPRSSPAPAFNRRPIDRPADESDFSDDEPINQHHSRRRLGIEHTRRPARPSHYRILIDLSDEALESGDEYLSDLLAARPNDEDLPQPPLRPQQEDHIDPESDHGEHSAREVSQYSDSQSDYGDHRPRHLQHLYDYSSDSDSAFGDQAVNQVQAQEEPLDNPSEDSSEDSSEEDDSSDEDFNEEEEVPDNELSQSEGSQSGESEGSQSGESEGSQPGEGQELAQELVHVESDDEEELDFVGLHLRRQQDIHQDILRQQQDILRHQQDQRREAFFRNQALNQALANIHQDRIARAINAAAVMAARIPRNQIQDLSDSGEDMDLEDELVEVVFDIHGHRRHQQRQNNPGQNIQARNNQGGAVEFIDLTEEPDSPVMHQQPRLNLNPAQHPAMRGFHEAQLPPPRRPRRMAQNGRPPSLARSDGSILGNRGPGRVTLIDLTNDDEPEDDADDDDDDALFVHQNNHIPANRRLPQPIPAPQRRNNRRSVEAFDIRQRIMPEIGGNLRQFIGRQLGNIGNIGNIGNLFHGFPDDILGENYVAAMNPNVNPNPLADNPPNFNYQANGWGAAPGERPKPQFEEPPPARPGFTRNTGPDPETGEEQTIICASCDNELKYYDDDVGEPPAKRAKKGKKAREEHHFWAVKACGHVSSAFTFQPQPATMSPSHVC